MMRTWFRARLGRWLSVIYQVLLPFHPLRPVPVGLVLLLVLAAPLVAWKIIRWSEQQAYETLATAGRDRLTLYGVALHSELDKSRNIPLILSSDLDVADVLSGKPPIDPSREHVIALNRRLETMNAVLGVDAIYLLDRRGVVFASSNWNKGAASFVGQHLDFRPYFRDAMAGRFGRHFAIGSTAYQPGYYVAVSVRKGEEILGTVAAKTSMDELEHGWSGGGERVFVTDRQGIVFITNTPQWRFHTLAPLSPKVQEELRTSRQYGDETLAPLDLSRGDVLTRMDGHDYVMVSQPLADGDGWMLNVLLDVREVQGRARDRGYLAVALMGVYILVLDFIFWRGRMLRRHARELERGVAERTVELVDTNHRLQDEVVVRQRAEQELKEKQNELVQAAKLAVLGRMSAGIVHEINQPLSAIRSYAENAVALLGMGRAKQVDENLFEIVGLTEQMAGITGQLKQFVRKSAGRMEPVIVANSVESALALLAGPIKADTVEVIWTPPSSDLVVQGDAVRLQQVIINLIMNALDALREVPGDRRLTIEAAVDAATVTLRVCDNGPGIAAEAMALLFDPFFTTKLTGGSLGLGLSISEGIIRDLGGCLRGANHPDGGAVFTVTLPRMEDL